LLYIVISQRFKNTKLKLKQEQQLANEEIYNLMLNQQNKVDEGRRNEKMRISQELHDGVLGRILGTRIVLGVLNDKTDETAVLKREECIDNLKEIEEELRDVSHRLHEKSLDADIGYIKLVENLLEKQCLVSEFSYEFKCDKNINWELVKGDLKMNLYRIIQESVQNINKYANAKHVKVLFRSEENLLYLTIRDNGKGFDVDAKSKGIGLKNIKSRVKSFNGIVNIESKPNQGTAIFIETPLKKPNFKTT
jgi:signal transduction histidine kinase